MPDPYLGHLGHFSPDGKSYTITAASTPHGWDHYLQNSEYLAAVNVHGTGLSFYKRPDGTRTNLSLHPDWPRRVYVRDQETGTLLTVPQAKGGTLTLTPGSATYFAAADGLSVTWGLCVPEGLRGEAWRITIRNTGTQPRKLLLTGLFPLTPHGYATSFGYEGSIYIGFYPKLNALFFDNHDPDRPDPLFNAFLCQDAPVHSFDTSTATFLGSGGFDHPAGLTAGKLANRLNCSMSTHAGKLAALASEHVLPAGGETTVQMLIGVAGDVEEVWAIRQRWLADPAGITTAVRQTTEHYRAMMDRVQIQTPDPVLDRLVNHWLGYNLCFTARWTRLYSRGFRDCMQDTQGVAALDPVLARNNLLEAMPHIYRCGRCRRAWAAGKGALLDQYYADQPVWVAPAIKAYLAETGDRGVLDEVADYFDGAVGTVWEHLVACQRHLYEDRGAHGLCLIHEGDWCDSAHRLGTAGYGEGVWLTMAYHKSLLDFLALARWLGRDTEAEQAQLWADEVRTAVNEQGWDGQWFRLAYNDQGRPIGTASDPEGRLFLNPQIWSVLAQVTTPERQRAAMQAVDEQLESWVGPHLLAPPFTRPDATIGSLTGFHPGTCENGTCYCHAAAFKIVADCLLGRGEQALATFRAIMPGGDADQQAPEPTCPPFAFTNSRMAAYHPHDAGKHGGTWITGTISWCFQAVTQYMLGVRPTLNGLTIDPCVPSAWRQFALHRLYRGCRYNVRVSNPHGVCRGVQTVRVNGTTLADNQIPPQPAGSVAEVDVVMR